MAAINCCDVCEQPFSDERPMRWAIPSMNILMHQACGDFVHKIQLRHRMELERNAREFESFLDGLITS
jgi:hypothetical protein